MQFSLRDYFTFASTFENGNVQLWDIRRPDRCERMFTAHNGPVFCCDWHPDDRCGCVGLWVAGEVPRVPGAPTLKSSSFTGAGWPQVGVTRW